MKKVFSDGMPDRDLALQISKMALVVTDPLPPTAGTKNNRVEQMKWSVDFRGHHEKI